jgi:hypothetical protein
MAVPHFQLLSCFSSISPYSSLCLLYPSTRIPLHSEAINVTTMFTDPLAARAHWPETLYYPSAEHWTPCPGVAIFPSHWSSTSVSGSGGEKGSQTVGAPWNHLPWTHWSRGRGVGVSGEIGHSSAADGGQNHTRSGLAAWTSVCMAQQPSLIRPRAALLGYSLGLRNS